MFIICEPSSRGVFTVIVVHHSDSPAGVYDQDPRLGTGTNVQRLYTGSAGFPPPATLTHGAPAERRLRLKHIGLIKLI